MLLANFAYMITGVALVIELIWCVKRRHGFARTFLYLLFVAYLGIVAAITLFPIPIDHNPAITNYSRNFNFIPFASIASTLGDVEKTGFFWMGLTIIGGNVALLIPLGFMLPYISSKLRTLPACAIGLLAFSCLIELTQLLIGLWAGYFYRSFDVDDLILNVVGGLVGYGIFKLYERARDHLESRSSRPVA